MKSIFLEIDQNISFKNTKTDDPNFAVTVVFSSSIQRYSDCQFSSWSYEGGNTWVSVHNFTKDELRKLAEYYDRYEADEEAVKMFNKGQYRKLVKYINDFCMDNNFLEYFDDTTKWLYNNSHITCFADNGEGPYVLAFIYGKLDQIQNDNWFMSSNANWIADIMANGWSNFYYYYNKGLTMDINTRYPEI